MSTGTMRPRGVGEILDGAIKIYVRNARTMMGIAAVVVIPLQVLTAIVLLSTFSSASDIPTSGFAFNLHPQAVQDPAAVRGAQALMTFISLIATTLVTAASTKAVSDAYLDQPTGIGVSLRFGLRRLLLIIAMYIAMIVCLALAFVALIVPAILLYVRWSVAVPALLIEEPRPGRALGRSWNLVKGRWWACAGVLLVASIMVTVIAGAVEALLVGIGVASSSSLVAVVVVTALASAVGSVLTTPFHAAVTTLLYYDLRVRHEGYDLQLLADQLGLPRPPLGADEVATGVSGDPASGAPGQWGDDPLPLGPESVGRPGGPPYWPPPPDWKPSP